MHTLRSLATPIAQPRHPGLTLPRTSLISLAFAALFAAALVMPTAAAAGEPPPGYGHLLVIGNHDTTQVEINGTAYPYEWIYGDMEGVFLPAEMLLEIIVTSGSDSRRTYRMRLDEGETRVIMVGIENQNAPAPRARPTRVERDRDEDDEEEEEEEDEEVGYLGVSSSPRGIVYVNGAETDSRTPARRIPLDPGRAEVQVYYDEEDVMSEVKHVLIRNGVNTNVFFRLRREQIEDD